ncbi:FUSC family protein [Acinetobacter sp. ANC 4633]|uniref:FUSC family protein n=1 Tax=Acinetobacter sp. ANC 4633 TaxID=2529845 RepID=UPI0010395D82|nr:FUSC family protein [Acinetobacter sp. ANC 4633]TCB26472.1 FUSC family protein [Acinetobacter sp. ANC 4633]
MLLYKQLLAFRPSKMDFIFAVKTFIAGMLALYIAFCLDLTYPMWAIGTVMIIVNPYSGMVSSKAVYRLLGTAAGAVVATLITPHLINTPFLFMSVVAAWVGFCLYISLLDRTPRSYVFMLAGYTTAMIVCNSINSIETVSVFDMALGRVLEISLAVVCTAVVFATIFPLHLGPAIQQRVDKTLNDTRQIFQKILTEHTADNNYNELLGTITSDIADIHALVAHLAYEKGELQGMTKPIQELLHQVTMIVSNLTAAAERIRQLNTIDAHYQQGVLNLHQHIRLFIQSKTEIQESDLTALPPEFEQDFQHLQQLARPEQQVMLDGLKMDIRHLIQNIFTVKLIWQLIQRGDKHIPESVATLTTSYPSLHRDHGMALRGAFAAIVAILVSFSLWVYTGWSAGYMMAQLAAVTACILTAMDNPVPALKMFIRGSIYAGILTVIYILGIMPEVKDFWQLGLVLAPVLIFFVMLYPHPPLAGLALPTMVTFIMSLNLQNRYSIDPIKSFEGCLGSVAGPVIAVLAVYFIRAISPEQSASRILSLHYKAMREALYLPYGVDFRIHLRSMLDRIGVLNTKLVQSAELKQAMNLALIETSAIVDLSRLDELANRAETPTELKTAIGELQSILDDAFRNQEKQLHLAENILAQVMQQITQLEQQLQQGSPADIEQRLRISLNNIRSSIFHMPTTQAGI